MFNNKKIHFIGIGGISMSGIAEILLKENNTITGYDMQTNSVTKHLESLGIKITYDYNLENVENADIIVYTAAINEDNPELMHAQKLHKELYERSTFFGLMMKSYKNVLCISGTHGKSTTSGMVSTIFMEAKENPTIQIGAILPLINGNNHTGSKEYFIAEACEYVDSFLSFFPTAEIILNIDDDHLDYFKNLDNIITSFSRYINLLPDDGILVINNDDENTVFASRVRENKITYGIANTSSYMAKNITYDEFGHPSYDLYIDNTFKIKINLSVTGKHNIYNSLAAIALSNQYIPSLEVIAKAIEKYQGVGRRFEYLGKCNGASVFDDYAHHPSEIKTTLDSVNKTKHQKSWAVFQSHTYSRTYDHLQEFADILANFDNIVIAPIYPAREENTWNVKEETLVKLIKENGNDNVIYIDSFAKIEDYLKENVQKDDLVITIGAGPINTIAQNIINKK